jgi:hypothetical protein
LQQDIKWVLHGSRPDGLAGHACRESAIGPAALSIRQGTHVALASGGMTPGDDEVLVHFLAAGFGMGFDNHYHHPSIGMHALSILSCPLEPIIFPI